MNVVKSLTLLLYFTHFFSLTTVYLKSFFYKFKLNLNKFFFYNSQKNDKIVKISVLSKIIRLNRLKSYSLYMTASLVNEVSETLILNAVNLKQWEVSARSHMDEQFL